MGRYGSWIDGHMEVTSKSQSIDHARYCIEKDERMRERRDER